MEYNELKQNIAEQKKDNVCDCGSKSTLKSFGNKKDDNTWI